MASFDVKLDTNGLKAMFSATNGPVWRDVTTRARWVQQEARRKAPTDTGTLKRSIIVEVGLVGDVPVAAIGTNLSYALWVHEGTGIYGPRGTPIVPRTAKALRWPIKFRTITKGKNAGKRARIRYKAGQTMNYGYAKSVRGVRGRPFLRDALPAATRSSTKN